MHLLAYFNPEAVESIQISWSINGLCKDVLELNGTVNLTVYLKTRSLSFLWQRSTVRGLHVENNITRYTKLLKLFLSFYCI